MVNTFKMLNIYDLKDLAHAYTRAYLIHQRKQKLKHDFGPFDEGRLIRTQDNSIFTLFTCPEVTNLKDAKRQQHFGSNIQEYFLNVVSHFLLNGYKKLPANKMKLAFCANHNNAHWTMLLVEFNGINLKGYESLYKKYQKHAERMDTVGNENQSNEVKLNNVKNFVMRTQGIRLYKRTKRGHLSSNHRLPLQVNRINIKHYDSMNSGENETVQAAARDFINFNNVNYTAEKSAQQSGNTCGDWTVYNAFTQGVLRFKNNHPTSKQLRKLQNNLTYGNASRILFAKNPIVHEYEPDQCITVTKAQRALAFPEQAQISPSSLVASVIEYAFVGANYMTSFVWNSLKRILPASEVAQRPGKKARI